VEPPDEPEIDPDECDERDELAPEAVPVARVGRSKSAPRARRRSKSTKTSGCLRSSWSRKLRRVSVSCSSCSSEKVLWPVLGPVETVDSTLRGANWFLFGRSESTTHGRVAAGGLEGAHRTCWPWAGRGSSEEAPVHVPSRWKLPSPRRSSWASRARP
jgi:hypothetical protein